MTADGYAKGSGFKLSWSGTGFNAAAAQLTATSAAANRAFKDQVTS